MWYIPTQTLVDSKRWVIRGRFGGYLTLNQETREVKMYPWIDDATQFSSKEEALFVLKGVTDYTEYYEIVDSDELMIEEIFKS